MRKILDLAASNPLSVLLMIVCVSLLAAWQVRTLHVDVSPNSLRLDGDPAQALYEQTIESFGADNITVLFLQDPMLFQADKLEAIRAVVEELQQLPSINRTQSLFSIPHLRVIDDFVHTSAYLEQIPSTSEEMSEIIKAASKNPFVLNNLLSTDGTTMAVNLYLSSEFLDESDLKDEIASEIERITQPLRMQLNTVFQVGLPHIRSVVRERIELDQSTIIPISVGILLITLLISLRRPYLAIIPLLTAGISVLWTLALMATLEIPLNVMSALVPVMLIIIGSTEDIHLITEFRAGLNAGHLRDGAVRFMVRRMALVVLLTFFTSFLGFLSIIANPIEIMQEFGLTAALGLGINFLITILFVPAFLNLAGNSFTTTHKPNPFAPNRRIARWLTNAVLSRRKTVIGFTLLTVVLACSQAIDIQVNNNILNYFDSESEVIQRVSSIHQQLSGVETLSVIVQGDSDGTFMKTHYLKELQKLQQFLREHPAFDYNVSFADYLSLLNSLVNDSGNIELPEDDHIVDELLLFVKQEHLAEYVSPDFNRTIISVRHNLSSSHELGTALLALQRFVEAEIDKSLEVKVTGESVLSNNAADFMAIGQVRSLLLMLTVIFIAISVLFFSPKAGLLATLPNLFLVSVLFGVMGFVDIAVDTGTAMIAAIALGVCVDHTMHFMARYKCNLKEYADEHEAICVTIQDEVMPISIATVTLAAGLSSLVFSSFTPVVHFGALSAMVMLLAFYANFFITPILLSYTRLTPCKRLVTSDYHEGLQATTEYDPQTAS